MSSAILVVTTWIELVCADAHSAAGGGENCVLGRTLQSCRQPTPSLIRPVNVAVASPRQACLILVGSRAALIWKRRAGLESDIAGDIQGTEDADGVRCAGRQTAAILHTDIARDVPLPASDSAVKHSDGRLRSVTLEWFTSPTTNVPLLTVVPRLLAVGSDGGCRYSTSHPVLVRLHLKRVEVYEIGCWRCHDPGGKDCWWPRRCLAQSPINFDPVCKVNLLVTSTPEKLTDVAVPEILPEFVTVPEPWTNYRECR